MIGNIWEKYRNRVYSVNYYSKSGILFSRCSGFMIENYLVTAVCSSDLENAESIIVSCESGLNGANVASSEITAREFAERIKGGSGKYLQGLTVFRFPGRFCGPAGSAGINRISCSSSCTPGTPVAVLSYSRQNSGLYIKSGMISSRIMVKGKEYLYIEVSYDPGNAGSPVINIETGNVIGILAEPAGSRLENHKRLKGVIDDNMRILEKSAGKITLGEIDPVQVLMTNQHMIKHIACELYLRGHANYGYAVPSGPVCRFIRNLQHNEQMEVTSQR